MSLKARLAKVERPAVERWEGAWRAWRDRTHRFMPEASLAKEVIECPEMRDAVDRMTAAFIASHPALEPLGAYIDQVADALPNFNSIDLSKWPADLPLPPASSVEQVEEFRKAFEWLATMAISAEAIYRISVIALAEQRP